VSITHVGHQQGRADPRAPIQGSLAGRASPRRDHRAGRAPVRPQCRRRVPKGSAARPGCGDLVGARWGSGSL